MAQIKSQSSSGASNIEKLSTRIKKKINKDFQSEQNFNNFDMSKLQQMKEQGNQDFFESMNKLNNQDNDNTTNQQQLIDTNVQPSDKQQNQRDDFLNLDFTSNQNDNQKNNNKKNESTDDMMFDFSNQETQNKKTKNLTDDFDLLNLTEETSKEQKIDILSKQKDNDEFNFLL